MKAPKLQLLERLERHARDSGDVVAVRDLISGNTVTYAKLSNAVDEFAKKLLASVAGSNILVLRSPNVANYTIAFLAALSAGHAVFPVSNDVAEAELRLAVERSGAAGVINAELKLGKRGTARAGRPCHIEPGPALLLQSSGTTGLPKIVH